MNLGSRISSSGDVHVVAERELITQNCEWKKKKKALIARPSFVVAEGERDLFAFPLWITSQRSSIKKKSSKYNLV